MRTKKFNTKNNNLQSIKKKSKKKNKRYTKKMKGGANSPNNQAAQQKPANKSPPSPNTQPNSANGLPPSSNTPQNQNMNNSPEKESKFKYIKTAVAKDVGQDFTNMSRSFRTVGKSIGNEGSRSVNMFLEGNSGKACSFMKYLDSTESRMFKMESLPSLVKRKIKEIDFFKKEDEYFKSLLVKNINDFCFERKETNDDFEYSRFCYNMVFNCLKTPRELHELLFDLIDTATTTKMYHTIPSFAKEKLQERIVIEYADEINENKDKLKTKKDKQAFMMTLIQKDNFKNFALFLVEVILKTIIEYKEAQSINPGETYKNKIVLELYIDEVLKTLLNKKVDNNEESENSNSNANANNKNTNKITVTETKKK